MANKSKTKGIRYRVSGRIKKQKEAGEILSTNSSYNEAGLIVHKLIY